MAKKIAKPTTLPADIIEAMGGSFEPWFSGETWNNWRTILRAAYCLPLYDNELAFFHTVAGDRAPPTERVRELWVAGGRRMGKDSIASLIAVFAAMTFTGMPARRKIAGFIPRLRRGERALVMCLAVDRDQARIILNYVRSYFSDLPELAAMVQRETKDGFELRNGVDVVVQTNSFRSVRGRAVLLAVLDEVAFWHDENSATPDLETYRAIQPGLATVNGMIVGISSPYRKSGLLFDKYRQHFAKDGDVLYIKASTTALNPTIDPVVIARAVAEDPAAASSEWYAEFRDDISGYISAETLDRCIVRHRDVLPPVKGEKYFAFVDPSGGASDSMVLAICHKSSLTDAIMLDAIVERKAPFSPDAVVAELAATLKVYGITKVRGDRYGGEWPAERFRSYGITYQTSDLSKSEIYLNALPLLTAGKCELLDNARMENQLKGLERRPSRGGREIIDHAPAAHDDIANAVCGALLMPAQSQRARVSWAIATDTKVCTGTKVRSLDGGEPCQWPRLVGNWELPPGYN
jgi:hypothetical protein